MIIQVRAVLRRTVWGDFAAVKLGVKLGRDKHYKRMGAVGAKGHHRANPTPWAV